MFEASIILGSMIILMSISIVLCRSAFLIVVTQGESMSPALKQNDRVLVWRFWPACWLHYGQIVVTRQEDDEISLPLLIKRISGLPGDTIIATLEEIPEDLRASYRHMHDSQGKRTWQVPPGHVFLRGDNHKVSSDSLTQGPVPIEYVCGIMLRKLSSRTGSAIC